MQSISQQSFLVSESDKTKPVNGECSQLSLGARAQLTGTVREDRKLPHQPLDKSGSFDLGFQRPGPHSRRTSTSTEAITIYTPPSSTGRKNNAFLRPAPMATRPFSRPQSAVVARANDWSNWVEVAVQFSGFPTNTSTKDIWNVFRNEGEILTIELFDDHNGNPSGRGRIRFR